MNAPPGRPRLLVVEDDRDVRETLLRILNDVGYEARGAADGLAALDELRRGEPYPALMLLDLRMPRMDGQRLQQEIARDPVLADAPIPIIVFSADSRRASEWDSLAAVAVLAKPVRLERLLSLIESVIGPPGATEPAK
jgi:two-component system, OmpR family, response regulator MprA